jgi:ribosomal protein S18 acetylase RimI-like enzyme
LEWITKINIDDYFLGNFIIEKNKRNKGLGTIIITHLENNCASKRMCVDVMANNINSIRLYKRLGYKINYTWDFGGKSHHRMIKVLKET